LTGTGTCDEDVTSAHFEATVSAMGAKLTSCSGDATTDIQCKLPLGAGVITVKALDFPITAGTVNIPVDVKTSSLIPASLAKVDVHIAATEQSGEDVICLDVHTTKQETLQAGGTLAVTWEDCGAKHAKVTDLQPTTIKTGSTTTLTGTGTCDEDVTSAHFEATVSAMGAKLTSCSGDATTDIQCKLPLGAGVITVKALDFPITAGTVNIPVDVKTSSLIPASLAKVDVHIAATEQSGEDVICLDVHTTKQETFQVGGTLAVTWEDCGAKHAKVTDLQPTTIETGSTTTLTGTGTCDEDVTSAHFEATVSAMGAKLTSCSGDATTDIQCKLPLGAGVITVKALDFPISAGTVNIPVDVKTSSLIPASLAKVDVHIAATEQSGEDVICLDVHTTKQAILV